MGLPAEVLVERSRSFTKGRKAVCGVHCAVCGVRRPQVAVETPDRVPVNAQWKDRGQGLYDQSETSSLDALNVDARSVPCAGMGRFVGPGTEALVIQ